MLNQDRIITARETAKTLFLDSQLIMLSSTESHRRYPMSKAIIDFVIETISDGGIIFLSTWEDVAGLWRKVRELDDEGLAPWLIQTSISFQAMAFSSVVEHEEWIEHLARCYGSYVTPLGNSDKGTLEKNLAVDDDLSDRLPKKEEFRDLLRSNAWFLYLVTLQLSAHEITSELVNQNKHMLGGATQGER